MNYIHYPKIKIPENIWDRSLKNTKSICNVKSLVRRVKKMSLKSIAKGGEKNENENHA